MKGLVEYIAKSIVTVPDAVVVTEEITADKNVILKLQVAPEDRGRSEENKHRGQLMHQEMKDLNEEYIIDEVMDDAADDVAETQTEEPAPEEEIYVPPPPPDR